jgi:hypothetical protein
MSITEVMPCARKKPGDLFAGTELFMVVLWGRAGVLALAENLDAKAEPLTKYRNKSWS